MIRQREPMRRSGRLRSINPERATQAKAEDFGPQADLCRTMPCCVCGEARPSVPHHTKTRAAGGSDEHTVPLCNWDHQRAHQLGKKTFDAMHGICLARVAAFIHQEPVRAAAVVGRPSEVAAFWKRLSELEVRQ